MNQYIYVCKYDSCNKYFEKPVILPCGHSMCQEHATKLDENENEIQKIKCPSCQKEHQIPNDGFQLNEPLNKSINLNRHLIGQHKEAKKRFDQLQETIQELKSNGIIDKDNYIFEYCSNIRTQIDLHREQLIDNIHKSSNKLLNELNEFEKECKLNKQNVDQIELNNFKIEEMNELLRKSKLSSDELKITIEKIDSTIYDLKTQVQLYKNELMQNKNIYFKPSFDPSLGKLIYSGTKMLSSSLDVKQIHENPISTLCTSKNDQIITGSNDGKIRIWSILNNETKCEQVLESHKKQIISLILNPKETKLFSASKDNSIKLWDLRTNKCSVTIKENSPISCLCLLPATSTLIVGCYNNCISYYDLLNKGLEKLYSFKAHNDFVSCLKAINQDQYVSGSKDKTIKIWRWNNNTLTLKGHQNIVNCLELMNSTENNKTILLSGSTDQTIRVWNILTSECLNIIDYVNEPIFSIKFIQKDHHLVIGTAKDKDNLKIIDLKNNSILNQIKSHDSNVKAIELLKDNKLITLSYDGTAKIWNVL